MSKRDGCESTIWLKNPARFRASRVIGRIALHTELAEVGGAFFRKYIEPFVKFRGHVVESQGLTRRAVNAIGMIRIRVG